MTPQATTSKKGHQEILYYRLQLVMTPVKSIQLAKLVICGAPLWLNQPDSLTSKSCFGRAFLHLQISSTVKLEEGSKDWMHRFSNLNTDSSHLVKHLQHDDTASCRHQNPSTISKNIKFSWNPNPKPFNKFDIETQAFFEDTVFPYKKTFAK